MNLKETLRSDMTAAMKSKDEIVLTTLRNILAAVSTAERAGKELVEFDDTQVKSLLSKEVKKREDTAEEYNKAGVADRAERELAEAAVLKAYLPAPLSLTEIDALAVKVIAEYSVIHNTEPTMREMGQIIKSVQALAAGSADGKTVSEIVKSKLS